LFLERLPFFDFLLSLLFISLKREELVN